MFEKLFCKHNWESVETHYFPPKGFEVKGVDPSFVRKMAWGFTQIVYECNKCKKTKVIEVLGKRE